MNAKRKGNRAEHRSIALLESAGYACTRAAASLGVFDIVGVSATDVVLVQVKSRDFPGSVEMEVIKNFQCPPLCKKIVHRRDRAPLPDVRTVLNLTPALFAGVKFPPCSSLTDSAAAPYIES